MKSRVARSMSTIHRHRSYSRCNLSNKILRAELIHQSSDSGEGGGKYIAERAKYKKLPRVMSCLSNCVCLCSKIVILK